MKIKKLNNTLNSLIQKANVFTYLKEKKTQTCENKYNTEYISHAHT